MIASNGKTSNFLIRNKTDDLTGYCKLTYPELEGKRSDFRLDLLITILSQSRDLVFDAFSL